MSRQMKSVQRHNVCHRVVGLTAVEWSRGRSVLKLDDFRQEARTITEGQFIARYNHPVLVVQGLVQGELLKQPITAEMQRQETMRVAVVEKLVEVFPETHPKR